MKNLVAKFGGSSLKDLPALERCVSIINSRPSTKVVVLSAVKGVTDKLEVISEFAQNGDQDQAMRALNELQSFHLDFIDPLESLFLTEALNCLFVEGRQIIRSSQRFASTEQFHDSVLALGERASSLIFYYVARKQRSDVSFLDARTVMSTNAEHGCATPQITEIRDNMVEVLEAESEDFLYITQGFIGSGPDKQTTTLGRDGSDYSAALFAEGISAAALQIWTDVPGLASSDPRYVEKTQIIHEINYEKAELLSRLGANILHPKTLAPAKRGSIPVFVGSSREPELPGTWIRKQTSKKIPVAGVAQKKNFLKIRLACSGRESGEIEESVRKLASAYNELQVTVKCNASQANLILNNHQQTPRLLEDLRSVGDVEVEDGYENLSIIGDEINSNQGLMDEVEKFKSANQSDVDLFDAGPGHLSFLVTAKNGLKLMNNLHRQVFLQYGG